jgi:ABC-type multidrug transport system permease subunit
VHLAVIAAWGIAGGLAAWRLFRWEPRRRSVPVGRVHVRRGRSRPGRRSAVSLVLGQVSYADRTMWRDVGAWFFALVFPALLLVLLGAIWRDAVFEGVPYPQALVPGVAAYGVAVTAFINLPEATATARDRGVLLRLRGTPLPAWAYLAGRFGSALWLGVLTVALVFAAGVLLFDVGIALPGVPALVLVLVLGTGCLLALGMALAAVLHTAKTFAVVSLAVLLPLSFLSGLFPFGVPEPAAVRAVASVFPLQHFGDALDEALRATTWTPVAWPHLAVLLAWGLTGAAVATRLLARTRRARAAHPGGDSAPAGRDDDQGLRRTAADQPLTPGGTR